MSELVKDQFEKKWAIYEMSNIFSPEDKAKILHGYLMGWSDGMMDAIKKVKKEVLE